MQQMISRPVRQEQMYYEHVLFLICPQGSINTFVNSHSASRHKRAKQNQIMAAYPSSYTKEAHYHTIKVRVHLFSREKETETHQVQAQHRDSDQVANRLGVNCPLPLIILLTSPTPCPTFVSAAIISSSVMTFFPSTLSSQLQATSQRKRRGDLPFLLLWCFDSYHNFVILIITNLDCILLLPFL